jgi:hypothetical protein
MINYKTAKTGEKVPRRRARRAKVPRDLQSRGKKKPPKGQRLANRRRVDLITTQTISRRFNSRAREGATLPTPRQANSLSQAKTWSNVDGAYYTIFRPDLSTPKNGRGKSAAVNL